MTVLGPHRCVVFSLVRGEQGPLPSCGACSVLSPCGARTLGYASFSSCGSCVFRASEHSPTVLAYLFSDIWDLPGSGRIHCFDRQILHH